MDVKNRILDASDYQYPMAYTEVPNRAVQLMPYYLWETPSQTWVLLNWYRQPPGLAGELFDKPADETHPQAVIIKPIDMDEHVRELSRNGAYSHWLQDFGLIFNQPLSDPWADSIEGSSRVISLLRSPFDLLKETELEWYAGKANLLLEHGLIYPDGSDADPFCLHFGDSLTFDIHDLFAIVDGGKA